MSALAVIDTLAHAGVRLVLVDERLKVRAASPDLYTPPLRQLVAEHRAAIVEALRQRGEAVPEALEAEATPELTPAPTAPAPSSAGKAGGDRPWSPELAGLIARLEALDVTALPEGLTLRPGVTVANPVLFVASLRAEVALGPGGTRARRGLLADDLTALFRALAEPNPAPVYRPRRPTPRPEGFTPGAHLASLGGFRAVAARFDPSTAHALWDSARLWERDQGTPTARRWEAQYWAAWGAAQVVED